MPKGFPLRPRHPPIFTTAEAVEEAFYDSIERGDLVGLMSLWADDEDVACVHPDGPRLVGLEAIRESWRGIFEAGGVHIRPSDVHIYTGAVLAVHHLVEHVREESPNNETVIECSATNVYIKLAVGWRMVLHHASNGPEIAIRQRTAALH
jgi:ketosteroid isomerase-like protein